MGSGYVGESSCMGWVRVVAKSFYLIPKYFPSLSKWLPKFNSILVSCFRKEIVKTVIVRDVEDLMQVLYLAQRKHKAVKYVGGSYPVNDKNCDCVISAREMKSVVAFNPGKAWITVEGGAKLGDILLFLRERGYTLQLYGSVPNMAIADALAVGTTGSNGSMSLVVQSCEVVQANGSLCHVEWSTEMEDYHTGSQCSFTVVEHFSTGPSEAGDIHYIDASEAFSECSLSSHLICERYNRPSFSLDAVICGLGLFGAVGLCTLKCIDLHLAHEDTQVLTLREMIQNRHNFTSCLYVKIRCFPLIGKFLVTKAVSVPPCRADWQPIWKLFMEKALITAYNIMANISPCVTFVYPGSAHALSSYQFHLLWWALILRRNCCFWPQQIVTPCSVYKGEEYVLSDSQINVALRDMLAWADRFRYMSTSPFKLSLRTLKNGSKAPILTPGNQNQVWSLRTGYFNGLLTRWPKNSAKSEFHAIMSRANASRCWNAAPVELAMHPHPGIGRVQTLRSDLGTDQTFRSAYIQDDLPPVYPELITPVAENCTPFSYSGSENPSSSDSIYLQTIQPSTWINYLNALVTSD